MEQAASLDPKAVYGPIAGNRWIQLTAGVVAMIVISNFQYAFTLFTPGLRASFPSVPYKDIALIFTLFILFETWPVPVAGLRAVCSIGMAKPATSVDPCA